MGKHRINSLKAAAKYGPRRRIIRLVKKRRRNSRQNIDVMADYMTEDELLDFYLSKDDILIPKEIWTILDRRAAECLIANNISVD